MSAELDTGGHKQSDRIMDTQIKQETFGFQRALEMHTGVHTGTSNTQMGLIQMFIQNNTLGGIKCEKRTDY